ncbi:MAG: hypothetical protein ACR2RD_05805 [Woeseiaceae bacterium]
MNQKDKDALIIAAALERLNKFRLPRILSLKKKVDGGEVLDDFDLTFLRRVLNDAKDLNPILERNPQYLELRDKALGLCHEILKKSDDNQS